MKPKFRAWDIKRKKFVEILHLIYTEDGIISVLATHDGKTDTPYFMEEIELLQFTGLTDKNGEEIFEGDICKWLGCEVKAGKQIRPERIFIVEWDIYKLAQLRNIIEGNGTLEVIGNRSDSYEWLENLEIRSC